jgi:hypothetical protein
MTGLHRKIAHKGVGDAVHAFGEFCVSPFDTFAHDGHRVAATLCDMTINEVMGDIHSLGIGKPRLGYT